MTPVLERTDVEQFRTVVARRLGLQYEDGKLDFLAEVARQHMELMGNARFESYLERLNSSPKGSHEFRTLAEQLTVNETFFFRNADNFRAFAELVLPERIRARSREKRLRILSAGCASGEEPYSLAVLVREALPDVGSWDVKIIAIDVNPVVLAKATEARYSAWSLRATSENAKRRYFREDGRDFVLDPAVQKMVTFEERNLVDEDPVFWQSFTCDVVFCRNVLMYFTPDTARDVVRRITQALLPGGFFFLGHAETLRGLTQEFHLCHTHDTFYYRRREASEAIVGATIWAGPPSVRPPKEHGEDSLAAAVESTASWVDVIHQASERIAALAAGRVRPQNQEVPRTTAADDAGSTAGARTWDLGLVLDALRQERLSEALEILCSLPPDSQEDPDALLLRAVLLTNNGRLDESENVCTRLLVLDELNAGAHYLIALCREHAGDVTGAIEHGQTAVYLDAGFAMPHLHLGIMARRSGDAAIAQRELGQALILLAREDASRLLLFGGGFSRDTLLQFCRTELRAAGSAR
jgi:chemotaxis protein methyltransferase CheR